MRRVVSGLPCATSIYNYRMADENHDDELRTPELEAKVLERFNPLKEERGRATVVSTAFYDKLADGVGALRLSRCRSKYTSAALNNIIHDE